MEIVGIDSYRELSDKSSLSPTAISKRRRESKLPTVEMAEGMCRALGVSWEELWAQAGYVQRVDPDQQDEREAVVILRELDPTKREAALQMLRGLASTSNATNQPTHASTTPEPEHSGIPEAEKLRPDEPDHLDEGTRRRLIAFYSLMDHSTPAEWEVYSQSLDEIRQSESKQEGGGPKGTEEPGGLREIVKE